ncbi:hypothetical protein FPV67DRAFT_1760543 [Lyophyllum atratum]|nr:hypothetical protein FPV67DRAFT_1760543 [Lyophyllum atratum]
MPPSIVIDSETSSVSYSSKTLWTTKFEASVYGGSYISIKRSENETNSTPSPPKMSITFQGTAIHFYGRPTPDLRLNYTYDGSKSHVIDMSSVTDFNGKTGAQLWGVDNLSDRSHGISLTPSAGELIFDYAVVTPGPSTYLEGHTLVADNTDSLIKYKGGGWQGSNKKGDSFTLTFVGKSISVYGLLNQQPGKLSSTYSIDGGPETTFSPYDGTQASSPDVWALHQEFFSTAVDPPGRHTLTVKVGEVTGSQMFWLDYISFVAIDSTRLTVGPPPKDIFSLIPKIVGGAIGATFFLLFIIFFFACRHVYKRSGREAILFRRLRQRIESQKSGNVEVPTRIHILRQPPHLTTPVFGDNHGSNPVVPKLKAALDRLRKENQELHASPPAAGSSSMPGFGRNEEGPSDAPYTAHISPDHAEETETAALRSEVDRLRRENERMRMQGGPSMRPLRVDDGRAEAPPAYNSASYAP